MPSTTPSVSIDATTITISLPDASQTVVPTIPEELRGHEVPSFVVEWILESDEVATLVQELLQAPTRSLCRSMSIGGGATKAPSFEIMGNPRRSSPTPPALREGREVQGFGVAEATTIEGLPTGIRLPQQVMEIIAMARKVDAWIWKGMRVTEWAHENGHGDASWLPAAD